MPKANLAKPPKYFRATPAKGISGDHAKPIERDGGRYRAGIIRGVSVITTGEALGHDMWIDETTLEQTADYINRFNKGVKSRYTHPSLSGDGLGKHVARVSDAYVDGDRVIGDQHFLQSAHDTPDGDLAGYLMNLADEDPEAYGLSIVFMHDQGAENEFAARHQNEKGEFISPDPRNVNNYRHVRIHEVRAADAVDEPAANPGGLFSREASTVEQAEALAAYAIGLTDEAPDGEAFGLDADRLRGFTARFLSNHELEVVSMKTKIKFAGDPPADDVKPEGSEETNIDNDEQPTEVDQSGEGEASEGSEGSDSSGDSTPSGDGQTEASRAEFNRFREAFGDRAADYFAEGLSFESAQGRFTAALREENEKLRQQLSAAKEAGGESEPIGIELGSDRKGSGFCSKIRVK